MAANRVSTFTESLTEIGKGNRLNKQISRVISKALEEFEIRIDVT